MRRVRPKTTFAEYYEELLKREGHPSQCLVDRWPPAIIAEISDKISVAVAAARIKGAVCPIRPNSSNQSVGNQVEAFFVPKLAAKLSGLSLAKCEGAGYPDSMLVRGDLKIPFEIKATADWNPADSNRRVLTSSSEKLRKAFTSPIYHLLCTIIYSVTTEDSTIGAIRLDFIEPYSLVNIRLEASVSHRLLASGQHKSITL